MPKKGANKDDLDNTPVGSGSKDTVDSKPYGTLPYGTVKPPKVRGGDPENTVTEVIETKVITDEALKAYLKSR